MSPLERRAWLMLGAMLPPYAAYFALQAAQPPWLASMAARIGCLAATAGVHAAVFVTGLVLLKRGERGQGLLADERDRAIDTRATRTAYVALLIGAVLAGVVMPFNNAGWRLTNAALLAIVLAEALRNLLIVLGYRESPRLAG
jgi:uncharacterized membrane protein